MYPEKQMVLETTRGRIASRMLDLICPIGFGTTWAYRSSAKSREDKLAKKKSLMELQQIIQKRN